MEKTILRAGHFIGNSVRTAITDSFQFTEADAFLSSKNVPRHTHVSSHFVLVIQGAYSSQARNNAGGTLGPGALIFNPAGTTHTDHFHSRRGRFLAITPTPDVALQLDLRFPVSVVVKSRSAMAFANRWQTAVQMHGGAQSELESIGLELAAHFVPPVEREGRHVPTWVLRARELLLQLCATDIKIAHVAAYVGMHPVHLARAFRRYLFVGPGELLRRYRMTKARDLLLRSTLPLSDIALEVGFSDQSHFTNAFKREMGLTPGQYREQGPGRTRKHKYMSAKDRSG